MYKLDLDKLAKVLGMLGSVHVGEREAAGRAADGMVRAAGVTWHDVLRPEPARPKYHVHDTGWSPEPEDDHRPVAEMLLHWHATEGFFLYEREPEFLNGLVHRHRPLSEAQQKWFDHIVLRARRNGFAI